MRLLEVEADSVSEADDDGLGEDERLLLSVELTVASCVRDSEGVCEGEYEMLRESGALNEGVRDPLPGDGVAVPETVLLRLAVKDLLATALADSELLAVTVKVRVVVQVAAGVQDPVKDPLAEVLGLRVRVADVVWVATWVLDGDAEEDGGEGERDKEAEAAAVALKLPLPDRDRVDRVLDTEFDTVCPGLPVGVELPRDSLMVQVKDGDGVTVQLLLW